MEGKCAFYEKNAVFFAKTGTFFRKAGSLTVANIQAQKKYG